VTAAADGFEALRAASARRYDVATMDLRMPGMHGREALAALRRIDPTLPVVVLSAYASPADVEECLALGAAAVAHKPITVTALLHLLEEARRADEDEVAIDPPP
jgi:CheY-like chemotaxis protein